MPRILAECWPQATLYSSPRAAVPLPLASCYKPQQALGGYLRHFGPAAAAMSATARARAALPGVAPIGGASTVHSEPARASAREVEEGALKQSSKSPAVDLSGTTVLHPAGSSDEPGAGGGSSAPPRRVSNAFLTQAAPGERVWLIVLNHTLPSVAARLWETGVTPPARLDS